MARPKSTRYLPVFSKNVLQDPERTREHAAWELLYAIRELFPDKLDELRAVGERVLDEYQDERGKGDKENKDAEDRFRRSVHAWTEKYGISCEAIDAAAAKYAVRDTASLWVYDDDVPFDENGNLIFHRTPAITAHPYNETRDQFLQRAALHYDDVERSYATRDNVKRGPVKRELTHFRYLAARLIGGHTFAEIARDPARFKVAAASPKTIAGEARKLASLIGLTIRTVPGPRPGSRLRKAAIRVRP